VVSATFTPHSKSLFFHFSRGKVDQAGPCRHTLEQQLLGGVTEKRMPFTGMGNELQLEHGNVNGRQTTFSMALLKCLVHLFNYEKILEE
jgi:hypothetical protein